MKTRFSSVISGLSVTALLLTSIVSFSSPALAEVKVQLSTFLIKVVEGKRTKVGQLPITVFLEIPDKRSAEYLCAIAPRVRDVILRKLNNETYVLNRKQKLNTDVIKDKISRPVIRSVKRVKILSVSVKQGAPKISSSSARLFHRTGCMQVADQ